MPATSAARLSLNAISVDLEVQTPDRLRKVVFSLKKTKLSDSTDDWKLGFQLFERKSATADFGDALVNLKVDAEIEHHRQAEETARKGLNRAQSDHLLGPASTDAKRFKAGKISEQRANATVEKTLPKRDEKAAT